MDRYEFIWKAIQIHGYKYNYSKVKYVNYSTKICIICPIHGEFWQTPSNHLNKRKYGCIKCGGNKNFTTEEFIDKAKLIHGNKYDYSKVKYVNAKTKICITCPEHGEFWQTPHGHLSGKGCFKCSLKHNNGELFVLNSLVSQFGKNEVIYQFRNKKMLELKSLDFYLPNYNIAIELQGKQHFEPISHFGGETAYKETLKRDVEKYNICCDNNIELIYYINCAKYYNIEYFGKYFCNIENLISYIKTKKYVKQNIKTNIIDKFKEIHGDKYSYSKVEYVNLTTKVCIICPQHGEFWQTPSKHLRGCGCQKCAHKSYTLTNESFIKKAKEIHNNKYNYSKVNYINSHTKVCIICPEHGEYYQTPNAHLSGCGCQKCKSCNLKNIKTLTTEEFINKAKLIYGDKYDYSKVKYINAKTKVCIICPEHGEFWQEPRHHLCGRNYNFRKK